MSTEISDEEIIFVKGAQLGGTWATMNAEIDKAIAAFDAAIGEAKAVREAAVVNATINAPEKPQ